MRGKELIFYINCLADMPKLVPQDNSQGTRNARGISLQVYINIYVCILTSKSILQSSTELAHVGYI